MQTRSIALTVLLALVAMGCSKQGDDGNASTPGNLNGTMPGTSTMGAAGAAGTMGAGADSGEGAHAADSGAPDADPPAPMGDNRPCEGGTLASGTFTFDLTYNGVSYPGYIVHVPPSYDGTKRTPLVVNWHGLTSTAAQQQGFSAMDPVSDEKGFIVVYPNSPDASWNAGPAWPAAGRDDAGYGVALVEEISKQACIDSKRVYATGMSNGGMMTHRLGCEYADVFAAIAPVAGKVGLADCNPSRPMPVMHFHGTVDPLVAYDNGFLSGENLSVPDTLQKWAARDGCKKGALLTREWA